MALDPVSMGISALQTGMGLVQTISGTSKLNKLVNQREAYKTPEEIDKILNLSMSMGGGDTITRDYQSNQLNRDFSSALGASKRLGADPNGISSLFNQMMNGKIKIGEEFHASNLEATSKIMSSLNLVADNKAAEWKSQQDILKDKIAAASGQVQMGYQNMGGGINTALGAVAASQTADLYKQYGNKLANGAASPTKYVDATTVGGFNRNAYPTIDPTSFNPLSNIIQ